MIDIEVFEKSCKTIREAIAGMQKSPYTFDGDNPLVDLEDEIGVTLWDLHNAEYAMRSAIIAYKEAVEMGEEYY